jgi:AcrR family transcriptional regulator
MMKETAFPQSKTSSFDKVSARNRVLQTATNLFYRQGIHSVGIDRIIAESGVAKMTFYRHFPSKARLIAEYLAQKEQGWQQLLTGIANDSTKTPLERVLALFDALELTTKSRDFAGCPFIKALAEFGSERNEPEVRAQINAHFADMERVLAPLLKEIRPKDSKKLLHPLMSLITGTIIVAQATGQTDVASRNKAAARTLLKTTDL